MSKNVEMMKKLIEEKKKKTSQKEDYKIPTRYSNQSNGSGKIRNSNYSK